MLDQTYDYAEMVAQFEADELFANRFFSFELDKKSISEFLIVFLG